MKAVLPLISEPGRRELKCHSILLHSLSFPFGNSIMANDSTELPNYMQSNRFVWSIHVCVDNTVCMQSIHSECKYSPSMNTVLDGISTYRGNDWISHTPTYQYSHCDPNAECSTAFHPTTTTPSESLSSKSVLLARIDRSRPLQPHGVIWNCFSDCMQVAVGSRYSPDNRTAHFQDIR